MRERAILFGFQKPGIFCEKISKFELFFSVFFFFFSSKSCCHRQNNGHNPNQKMKMKKR